MNRPVSSRARSLTNEQQTDQRGLFYCDCSARWAVLWSLEADAAEEQ